MASIRPAASSQAVRLRMQATAQRDNFSERQVRSALHKQGLRFRIHYRVPVLGRRSIDIALVRSKIAIFIDGCFWHCCPKHATFPKSNRAWWLQKIRGNKKRDLDTSTRLKSAGWKVLRFWEHERLDVLLRTVLRQHHKRQFKTARTATTPSVQSQATERKRRGSRTKL
jgi:DNA mismatch endonuclease (patch repair protein)